MARFFSRRMGPIGIALTAFDIYRRIPPQHRKRLWAEARKHGPSLARAARKASQNRKRRRRP